jgi:hypothetical protein
VPSVDGVLKHKNWMMGLPDVLANHNVVVFVQLKQHVLSAPRSTTKAEQQLLGIVRAKLDFIFRLRWPRPVLRPGRNVLLPRFYFLYSVGRPWTLLKVLTENKRWKQANYTKETSQHHGLLCLTYASLVAKSRARNERRFLLSE